MELIELLKKAFDAGFNRGAEQIGSTAGYLGLKLESPTFHEWIEKNKDVYVQFAINPHTAENETKLD